MKGGASEKIEKKARARYYLDRTGAWAQLAVIFMLLSAIARLLGVWGPWGDSFFLYTQILLPLAANMLFVLFVFLFGNRGFFLSIVPVLMGVAFFIIKSLGFESLLHTALCILLYLAVAVIYSGTLLGFIRTKWLLPPLFALPFVYHIVVEDLPRFTGAAEAWTFASLLQEVSVLCVMVCLFCVGMGLKKREPKAKKPETVVEAEPVQAAPSQDGEAQG